MTLHTELPIYKVAYDLLSLATDLVQNMPRPIKAALGGRVSAPPTGGSAPERNLE